MNLDMNDLPYLHKVLICLVIKYIIMAMTPFYILGQQKIECKLKATYKTCY